MKGGAQPGAINFVVGRKYRLQNPNQGVNKVMILRQFDNHPNLGLTYNFETEDGSQGVGITVGMIGVEWIITQEPQAGGKRRRTRSRRSRSRSRKY